jgi:hypothetical protein
MLPFVAQQLATYTRRRAGQLTGGPRSVDSWTFPHTDDDDDDPA